MIETFLQGVLFGVAFTLLLIWVGIYLWLNRVGAIVLELPEEDGLQDNANSFDQGI